MGKQDQPTGALSRERPLQPRTLGEQSRFAMDRDGSSREPALDEAALGVAFLVRPRNHSRSQRATGEETHNHRDMGASDALSGSSMASQPIPQAHGRDGLHRFGTGIACTGSTGHLDHHWPVGRGPP
jgi:hypothetical protein